MTKEKHMKAIVSGMSKLVVLLPKTGATSGWPNLGYTKHVLVEFVELLNIL